MSIQSTKILRTGARQCSALVRSQRVNSSSPRVSHLPVTQCTPVKQGSHLPVAGIHAQRTPVKHLLVTDIFCY